jgi:hypothetical protein
MIQICQDLAPIMNHLIPLTEVRIISMIFTLFEKFLSLIAFAWILRSGRRSYPGPRRSQGNPRLQTLAALVSRLPNPIRSGSSPLYNHERLQFRTLRDESQSAKHTSRWLCENKKPGKQEYYTSNRESGRKRKRKTNEMKHVSGPPI